MTILTATILVGAIGLVCALLLVVASHYMAVKVNETEVAVRACLPGANCGACGYSGCDGYAAALAADPTLPANLCRPGGAEATEKISAVLGVDAAQAEPYVAFVRCSGDCNARGSIINYEGVRTCSAAKLLFGGASACTFGCLGYGSCEEVCPADAICIENGIAHIDPRRCVGCGLCAKTCPNNVITLLPVKKQAVVSCSSQLKGPKVRASCTNGCIACTKCVRGCTSQAITIENNLARVDPAACTACGECVSGCPTGAVRILF